MDMIFICFVILIDWYKSVQDSLLLLLFFYEDLIRNIQDWKLLKLIAIGIANSFVRSRCLHMSAEHSNSSKIIKRIIHSWRLQIYRSLFYSTYESSIIIFQRIICSICVCSYAYISFPSFTTFLLSG